jgi:hypothetical protein
VILPGRMERAFCTRSPRRATRNIPCSDHGSGGQMATEGSKVIARGALAGVLSAIVMGIQWMVISGVNGAGFFTPLALIGATFTREAWMTSFAGSVVTGTLLHLFTGAALGALFAFLTRDMVESGNRFAAGIAYAGTCTSKARRCTRIIRCASVSRLLINARSAFEQPAPRQRA